MKVMQLSRCCLQTLIILAFIRNAAHEILSIVEIILHQMMRATSRSDTETGSERFISRLPGGGTHIAELYVGSNWTVLIYLQGQPFRTSSSLCLLSFTLLQLRTSVDRNHERQRDQFVDEGDNRSTLTSSSPMFSFTRSCWSSLSMGSLPLSLDA